MLPGGGIGPELMSFVKEVFMFGGVPINFETIQIYPSSRDDDLQNAITSIRRNGVAIKGNLIDNFNNEISHNVAIRNELDLFVNVLHMYSYKNVPSKHQNIDIIVVRQNIEGEYTMLEHEVVEGVVEYLKVITKENSRRLARYAFELALNNGRKKVTSVHKANIMKLSDGLFLKICFEMAKEYPDLQFEQIIVDNCCMQLVSNPHQFDVMVMPNLYGTIITNIICGLVGGVGLISGRNYGENYAVFEPGTRNTGTDIVGSNIANPVAMLNASADMLEHLGLNFHCDMIRTAITKTLSEDLVHTMDLCGKASTTDVVGNIIKHVKHFAKM
ncbi:isocitrate dehydrogenase [NAD] subunit gamma, mitochondrial-like [Daktulosphaira vitifoliae]|uniref:isocitrate dehydrogenase [NAD] subunit gamma, mitochondrial-like n=1 Tax=Daktulosphaira vitifoliae TaxID=58002 RepID=UPI0021A9B57E|nr:isocitrate dehydrogenase [NAD] subunit gamma, mitochondrial-like [Daktulosphaira vitifoliae]